MIELGQQRHIKVESPIDKKEFRKRMKENDLLEED